MGKGARVGKVATGYLVAVSLGLSATGAFAQSQHPPIEQNASGPGATETSPANQVGCDPAVAATLQSSSAYAAQQASFVSYQDMRQPTTYFGCLTGLLNDAQTLANAFNGTGSLSSLFSGLLKVAVGSLLSYLSNTVCQMVGNIIQVPSIPGFGGGGVSAFAPGGTVMGSSVTSMLGVPQNQNVPIDPNYPAQKFVNNLPYNPSAPPVPPGNDSGADMNWALATGGLSIRAAAATGSLMNVPQDNTVNEIFAPGGSATPAGSGPVPTSSGQSIPNLPPPPAVSGLASIPAGQPDAAGAYTPAVTYTAGTDPSSAQGSGELGTNKSPLNTSYYYDVGAGQKKVCVHEYSGSIPWRDYNPGDLSGSDQANGALGVAGRFTVYPNADFGTRAIYEWMLFHNTYYGANHTIADAISHYAPPNENNTSSYTSNVAAAAGVPATTRIGALNQSQLTALVNEIKTIEGAKVGKIDCKNYP